MTKKNLKKSKKSPFFDDVLSSVKTSKIFENPNKNAFISKSENKISFFREAFRKKLREIKLNVSM